MLEDSKLCILLEVYPHHLNVDWMLRFDIVSSLGEVLLVISIFLFFHGFLAVIFP